MLATAWQLLPLLFTLVSRLFCRLSACTFCVFSCLQAGQQYRVMANPYSPPGGTNRFRGAPVVKLTKV